MTIPGLHAESVKWNSQGQSEATPLDQAPHTTLLALKGRHKSHARKVLDEGVGREPGAVCVRSS